MALELPVEGFPISDTEIQKWFVRRHGRTPSAEELAGIINDMAAREASPPVELTETEAPPRQPD